MTTSIRHTFGLGLLLLAGAAQAADVPINLWARQGSTTLPDGATALVVGYVEAPDTTVTAPGGPVLAVNQGDVVTVTLVNALAEPTGMVFQGQSMVPDTAGVAPGGSTAYTFTAASPGTFLYEAAPLPNAQHQAAMGLHGALVVRPSTPGQAYDGSGTAYDDEAVLVLSELDPAVWPNPGANPALFDMRNFAPRYFLINGKAYPDTDAIPTAAAGRKVLLRYVNAGIQHHSMTVLGTAQTLVAKDGSQLGHAGTRAAETIAPGETLDAIVTVPAAALPGSRFAVFDASLMLTNNGGPDLGGMLTFVEVSGTPGGGGGGPAVASVSAQPNPTGGSVDVTVSASIPGADAAEFFVDSTTGNGRAMAGAPPSFTGTLSVTDLAALASGDHTLYVRGLAAGIPGPFNFVVLNLDKTGPTSTGLVVAPASSRGDVDVVLTGTGSDQASGNGSVTAAEYFVGTAGANGSGTAMTVTPGTSPVANLAATIPAATMTTLVEGLHPIQVHSKDALGNWGAFASPAPVLVVDRTAPAVATPVATPSATNGTTGFNSTIVAVRVTTTATDPLSSGAQSTVAAVEGFLDTVGPDGTGFVFLPADGLWNGTTEAAFGDIPLTALAPLLEQNHPILVHARDTAGNWGPASSVNVLVDRTVPTFTGLTLVPGTGSVALTITGATDPAPSTGAGPPSGVTGGEYWLGATSPAPGGGTPFAGTTASIPTGSLAGGTYTVGVRIRDAAGNWSQAASQSFTIGLSDLVFADGFESGNTNAWSRRSTNSTTRLNVTAAAALVGTRGLQALANNANYVQYDFGTAANPATRTFDARFHLRPNGAGSQAKNVFTAATNSGFGTTVFRVRYRLSNSIPQVQIQVGGANANGSWTNLAGGTADNVVEVVWQSAGSGGPNPGTLVLRVNGVAVQTLNTTSTLSVGAFRLGSVTGAGNATAMYFDQFAAKRSATPLLGP